MTNWFTLISSIKDKQYDYLSTFSIFLLLYLCPFLSTLKLSTKNHLLLSMYPVFGSLPKTSNGRSIP